MELGCRDAVTDSTWDGVNVEKHSGILYTQKTGPGFRGTPARLTFWFGGATPSARV
jgi:hypothetical protein